MVQMCLLSSFFLPLQCCAVLQTHTPVARQPSGAPPDASCWRWLATGHHRLVESSTQERISGWEGTTSHKGRGVQVPAQLTTLSISGPYLDWSPPKPPLALCRRNAMAQKGQKLLVNGPRGPPQAVSWEPPQAVS